MMRRIEGLSCDSTHETSNITPQERARRVAANISLDLTPGNAAVGLKIRRCNLVGDALEVEGLDHPVEQGRCILGTNGLP